MLKNTKGKAVLYLEVDDKKKKIKISFPKGRRQLTVSKIEAVSLAGALNREIDEWDSMQAASPKENLEKLLMDIAGLVFPDKPTQPSNKEIGQSHKARLCILVSDHAECLFGIPIPSVGTDFDKLQSAIGKYKATIK